MKVHLNITGKLTFILVLFGAVLLVSLGALAYTSGQAGLQQAATSELLTRALEKQAALDNWISVARTDIATQAGSPVAAELAAALLAAAPGSLQAQAAHDRLVREFQPYVGPTHKFTDLFFLEAESGQVLAATDPSEEGKFKENRSYFINGKRTPYVSEMYYSLTLGGPAMTAAAPVVAADGRLLGVLAGKLDLEVMHTLISRRSGLRQTDDAYLLNITGLLVTQPRFISAPILQPMLKTEAAKRCLGGNSGMISTDDYRGVPALISYRWLPERQMCLIVKIDQAEAFAPSLAFGRTIVLTGGLALALSVALAVALARSFTRPLLALQTAAARLGQGDLEYRVAVKSQDEIGRLTAAFNEMAGNLQSSRGETAYGQRLLLALSQAAQAVQRARTPEEVYRIVGDEVARLGYNAVVITLTDDRAHLSVPYMTFKPGLLRAAEKLTGLSAQGYRFPLVPGSFFQRIIAEGETAFSESTAEVIAEAIPGPLRPLAGRLVALLGLEQVINAPLTVGGERHGLLVVFGAGLTEADVPAVTTFANQAAIALENTRAAATLRESEAKYRNLTESLDELIYRADPATFVATYVNRAVERIYGYTVEEFLGDPTLWESTIHPEDKERVFAWFTEAQRKMESGAIEYRIIRKDKTVRWGEDHVSWEKDQQGNLVSMTGVMYDITERKQAEEQTKQLQEYLQLQIERMPIGLIVWDTEFRATSWNPAAEKIFGFTAQEALGKHPYGLIVPKEAQPQVDDIWRRLLQGDTTAHSTNENITKDGRTIICQWSNTPLRKADGTVMGVLSMVQDITERKQAEEALARRMTELSALNAMAAIVNESVNVDEILNRAMDEALRLVGVEAAGMLLLDEEAGELALVAHRGLSDEFVRAFSRMKLGEGLAGRVAQAGEPAVMADLAEYPGALKAYVEKERVQSAASVPLVGRRGVIGVMNLAAASPQYFDPAGLELLIALGQQIAIGVEKARLYEETRAWAARLERRVDERTAELEAANKELEAFSYSVSHDLRAPLRAIDGFSRILLEEHQRQLAPEAQRHLQLVRDNTQQMGHLIDDLLAFSRLGRQRLEKQPVAPADLVRQALEELRSQQEGRKVEISIGDPSAGSGQALPVCQADPHLLKQVWVNLLSNALKFTRQREAARIEIGWIPPLSPPLVGEGPGEGCYFVKDNGAGFDMQYVDKLFGVFQRLHRAEEYEGSGVGLATVQRIIHRHGGRVWAEAEVDKGATFYFTLG